MTNARIYGLICALLLIVAAVETTCAQPRRQRVRPTHADVKYGQHERNVMDVWLAESEQPTPVLVSIQGGGFRGGNKSV